MKAVAEVKTVLQADLKGYTGSAREVSAQLGTEAVAMLNRQLLGLVESAVTAAGLEFKTQRLKTAGDGFMLFLDEPADAVAVAEALQRACVVHNSGRNDHASERWFRMAAVSGEVLFDASGEHTIAAIDAVRLESGGARGHLLVNAATFEQLPGNLQSRFLAEEVIRVKREEFRVRRLVFEQAPDPAPRLSGGSKQRGPDTDSDADHRAWMLRQITVLLINERVRARLEATSSEAAAEKLLQLDAVEALYEWTDISRELLRQGSAEWHECTAVFRALLSRLVSEDSVMEAQDDLDQWLFRIRARYEPQSILPEIFLARADTRREEVALDENGQPVESIDTGSAPFSALDVPQFTDAVNAIGMYLSQQYNLVVGERMTEDDFKRLESRLIAQRRAGNHCFYLTIDGNKPLFSSNETLDLLYEKLPSLPRFVLHADGEFGVEAFETDVYTIQSTVEAFWSMGKKFGAIR